MTGIVGYRCPNYLDCLQQSGERRECSVYYYYYWGEEGQLIVSKNASLLGWAIAEELPCEYDFEISALKVIKNQEKMGYYTPVLLPVQRKKIIIYPENIKHFYESVKALVVEPTATLSKNSELVNCGWHKAISIYPFWDKFCQDIYAYVENNILTKTKEYQSFDYLGTEYHVESVYHCPAKSDRSAIRTSHGCRVSRVRSPFGAESRSARFGGVPCADVRWRLIFPDLNFFLNMGIPKSFTAGDRVSWQVPKLKYDTAVDTMACFIRGRSNPIDLTGTPTGSGWVFEISETQSKDFLPGKYSAQIVVFSSAGRETLSIFNILVHPSFEAITELETRSSDEIELEEITKAIARLAGGAVAEYRIGDRMMRYQDLEQLTRRQRELRLRIFRAKNPGGTVRPIRFSE